MISATTGFEAAEHGFHFRNSYRGDDVIAAVAPGSAAEVLVGNDDFWKGWGLCGGMSWSALDRFLAGEPIPGDNRRPSRTSQLFQELVHRQLDSFDGIHLLSRCVDWQSRADTRRWWDPRDTTWRMTTHHWPLLKQSIDAGVPASLTLIRTKTKLSKNHQVLATGYCVDAAGIGYVTLYDPNHPGETPNIRLRLDGPEAGRAEQSTGEPLRGFFVWRYRPPQSSLAS